jgi:hypothetical protein
MITEERPFIDSDLLLEKFPGKGGWTYTRIPHVPQEHKTRFGWLPVRGFIDDYEIKNYNLAPLGKGALFLPVKAAIRKKIGKQAGDQVHVRLYVDVLPALVPEELELCLQDEPAAYQHFLCLTEEEKKKCISWIDAAGGGEKRITRIAQLVNELAKGNSGPWKR